MSFEYLFFILCNWLSAIYTSVFPANSPMYVCGNCHLSIKRNKVLVLF